MRKILTSILSILIALTIFVENNVVFASLGEAKIGDEPYDTLAEALETASSQESNVVITLLNNVTLTDSLDVTLTKGYEVTLDLNEKTLAGRINLKQGKFTVMNGTVAGGDKQPLNVYGSSDNVENYSVLTIAESATVTGDKFGVCMFGKTATSNGYGAVVNVYGKVSTTGTGSEGTVFVSGNLGNNIDADEHNIININNGAEILSVNDAALALNGNATVNIADGSSLSGNTAIAVKRGVLNVEGGNITSTGSKITNPNKNQSGTEMTGAGISITDTYIGYGPLVVNVNGGTISSTNGYSIFKKADNSNESKITINVKGGNYSDLECLRYLVQNTSSPIEVNLLNDVTNAEGITIKENTNVKVNFNGKTYTCEGPGTGSTGTKNQAFQLLKNSNIEFVNGEIKSGNNFTNSKFIIQNYANLTLDGITLDGTNLKDPGSYTLSNNSGDIEIKGGSVIKADTGKYALDAYGWYQYYPYGPVVTVDGATINGKIDYDNDGNTPTREHQLIIKNSTINDPYGINFVPQGCETNVVLDSDVEIDKAIEVAGKVTLDLQGKTIKVKAGSTKEKFGSDSIITILRGGELASRSLNDPTNKGTIDYNNNTFIYSAIKMTKKGEEAYGSKAKLTIDGGNYIGSYYGIVGNGDRHDTEITINTGVVKGTIENDSLGIYHPQNGSLTINGGTIEGASGLYIKSGNIAINGGTITANGAKTAYGFYGNGAIVTGDAMVVDFCDYPGTNPTVNVTSGTFTSENAGTIKAYIPTTKTNNSPAIEEQNLTPENKSLISTSVNVSGGTYNDKINELLLAENYKIIGKDTNKYEVVKYEKTTKESDSNIRFLVEGDVDMVKNVDGLDKALDEDALNELIEGIKVDNPAATSIDIVFSMEAMKIEGVAITLRWDETSKINIPNTIGNYVFFDLNINQIVNVDGEFVSSTPITETNVYQYVPVHFELGSTPENIVVGRVHNGVGSILKKAANKTSAEHYDGDCYYIDKAAGTVVIKSKNFSVYKIANTTQPVEAYEYIEYHPSYKVPKTGIDRSIY